MNIQFFFEEIDMAGCVQLYHPSKPKTFFIFEQKLGSQGFLSIQDYGMYLFSILPQSSMAVQTDLSTIQSVLEKLFLLHQEGWIIGNDSINIPKKNFVKWQLCQKLF